MGVSKNTSAKPPTVGAIVTQVQWKLRTSRQINDARSRRNVAKHDKLLCQVLGIKLIPFADLKSHHPQLHEYLSEHGVAVILPDGQVAVFAAPAAKGTIGKMRRRGIAYLQDLITGRISQNRKGWPTPDALPLHVREYLGAEGLDTQMLEMLNFLLMRVEFRHNGARYRLSSRWKKEIRKRMDEGKKEHHLAYDTDPSHREVETVQITLPGKPMVRLTKHGLSVRQQLPLTLRQSLRDRSLKDVIEIPHLSDYLINTARPLGQVTHLTLRPAP